MSRLRFAIVAALLSTACSEAPGPSAGGAGGEPSGVRAIMRFEASAGFFDAPFPIEHRRNGDGTLRLDDFPDPGSSASLTQILALVAAKPTGFSLNGAVFLRFDGAIDAANLPSPRDATKPESPLFLVNVTKGSEGRGRRVPIVSSFKSRAETYSPENLLAVMPYPGFPLEPDTTYAVVVRTALGGGAERSA